MADKMKEKLQRVCVNVLSFDVYYIPFCSVLVFIWATSKLFSSFRLYMNMHTYA